MSNSASCKIVVTALIVAFVMGSLGFVVGFLTHGVIVAAAPGTASHAITEVAAVNTATPAAMEASPTPAPLATAPSGASPEPSAAATIEIPGNTAKNFDLFWEVWNLIQQNYYGDLPTDEEMTYGAIRGALDTLDDPYTGFLDPDLAAISREDLSGAFEGIGAYVTMNEGLLEIASTFKDQPAQRAGLRRGDIVLKVDDTPIENMSIYEAITLIRGPAGTPVRLTILREGEEPFEVEVVRARIEVPVVESEMREDGIAYVRLNEFTPDASANLAEAIKPMLEQNPKGLILDLRGNPGGWMNEAILTAGLFLPKDDLVLIERTKDGAEQSLRNPEEPIAPDIPMVVLVDAGSASASEIVAGALQDHQRAVLIGEKTFGKGSVWTPLELSNGGELRVTVARWFTPNDRAIHGEGLEPDVAVELTQEDFDAERDPQLDRAVEYLLSGQ